MISEDEINEVESEGFEFTFDYLLKKTKSNEEEIKNKFGDDQRFIEQLFKIQTEIANKYLRILLGFPEASNDKTSILLSAYWKNIVSLFAAFELINKGLYGPSKALIRYSFEYLFLAKYCEISNDLELLKRWEDGDHRIKLQDHVFNKLKRPPKEHFELFWRDLCKFSHATIYSMQIVFEEDKEFDYRISETYNLIKMILRCNYHLINSHLVNKQARFYTEYYLPNVKKESKELREQMKELFNEHGKNLTREGKTFIRNYQLKWSVKVVK